MEFELHGDIFAINHNDYDFKNAAGERITGTSHKITVLDFATRTVHEVKIAEDALRSLDYKQDGKFDALVSARANNNKMTLTFVQKVAHVAVAKAS